MISALWSRIVRNSLGLWGAKPRMSAPPAPGDGHRWDSFGLGGTEGLAVYLH